MNRRLVPALISICFFFLCHAGASAQVPAKVTSLEAEAKELSSNGDHMGARTKMREALQLVTANSCQQGRLFGVLGDIDAAASDETNAMRSYSLGRSLYAMHITSLNAAELSEYSRLLTNYANASRKFGKASEASALMAEAGQVTRRRPGGGSAAVDATFNAKKAAMDQSMADTVSCCYAVKDIMPGTLLRRDMLRDFGVPRATRMPGAIERSESAIGRKAIARIARNSPVTQQALAP